MFLQGFGHGHKGTKETRPGLQVLADARRRLPWLRAQRAVQGAAEGLGRKLRELQELRLWSSGLPDPSETCSSYARS